VRGRETAASCADVSPPAVCGNGVCEVGETPARCGTDCPPPPVCGNGICEGPETATCPNDCVSIDLVACKDSCDTYDFFHCLGPGELQTCYDRCDAATGAQLKQFNNCAGPATVSCDLTCLDFLP
jgi:hypothetical protein